MSDSDSSSPGDIEDAFDAVERGDLARILSLTDVNLVNHAGRSLLAAGGIELCELLVQHGADVRGVDSKGNSVLHVIADQGAMSLYAAYMTRYLLGAGADARAVNGAGETALHRAVQTVSKATVRALVEAGTPVDMRDSRGKTASETAREFWTGQGEHTHLAADYPALLRELRRG